MYRTMQGKEIDMDKLAMKNELVPAVGNMKVNARGDQIGNGGKIIKKREDIIAEYYETNPKAKHSSIPQTAAAPAPAEPVVETKPVVEKSKKQALEE